MRNGDVGCPVALCNGSSSAHTINVSLLNHRETRPLRRGTLIVGITVALLGTFSPAAIAASATVTQISVGTNGDQAPAGIVNSVLPTSVATHACALRSDGKVRCWGSNSNGELGNGTTTNSSTAVGVTGITTATQIAVGGAHTCALLSGGTIKCWGANNLYQTGDGVNTTTIRTTPVSVSGISNAVQISAGNQHTCAVLSDGTTKCWGANNYGQYGNASITQPTDRLPVATPDRKSVV